MIDTLLIELDKCGIKASPRADGLFAVRSNATGAVMRTDATWKDLEDYLRCVSYVKTNEATRIELGKHPVPLHG